MQSQSLVDQLDVVGDRVAVPGEHELAGISRVARIDAM